LLRRDPISPLRSDKKWNSIVNNFIENTLRKVFFIAKNVVYLLCKRD